MMGISFSCLMALLEEPSGAAEGLVRCLAARGRYYKPRARCSLAEALPWATFIIIAHAPLPPYTQSQFPEINMFSSCFRLLAISGLFLFGNIVNDH